MLSGTINPANNNSIDVSTLKKGAYFLQLIDDSHQLLNFKFLKQ